MSDVSKGATTAGLRKKDNIIGWLSIFGLLITTIALYLACAYEPIGGYEAVLEKNHVNVGRSLFWQKSIYIPTSGEVISCNLVDEKYKVVVDKKEKEIRISGLIFYCIRPNIHHDGEENRDSREGEVVLGVIGSLP